MGACNCDCACEKGKYQAVLLRGTSSILSPWIARRGDYLRATAELVAKRSHGLRVDLYTKNSGDVGPGVIVHAATRITLSAVGRQTQEWSPTTGIGLHELVRYRFRIDVATPPADTKAWVAFRMLAPCWFDAVRNPLS